MISPDLDTEEPKRRTEGGMLPRVIVFSPCSVWSMPLETVGFCRLVRLGTEVRGGRAGTGALKVAGKNGLDQGSEDDLSAAVKS